MERTREICERRGSVTTFAVPLLVSVCVEKPVVAATVLAPVDGLGVAADVNLGVAQVRVQLVDDRRTHVNEVQLTDVRRVVVVVYVEHV